MDNEHFREVRAKKRGRHNYSPRTEPAAVPIKNNYQPLNNTEEENNEGETPERNQEPEAKEITIRITPSLVLLTGGLNYTCLVVGLNRITFKKERQDQN